ncbi:MAG: peptide chain release factor N(5)-glutamine methyltransferase [Erysipelotrichaceae bacterium]
MESYRNVLKTAQKTLAQQGRSEQLALLYLLELSNANAHDLYMQYEELMPENLQAQYLDGIARIATGEPLQHVLGFEWFFGRRFRVSEHVLIPRPETEELVANVLGAIDEVFGDMNRTLIDVGTGSGAIAISLKGEERDLEVHASDISADAIAVAKANAMDNEVEIDFMFGDMLQPFIDANIKVDILVSNPPYIPQDEVLEDTVVDFEPHVALFGGNDGLFFYRIILQNAHKVLKEKAILAFEMGYDQGESLSNLAKEYYPNARIEVLQDINGKDRMLFVYVM